ncbi:UNVERIFIED_CONTAM: hypothetical protein Scaly_0870800 [Sesamum calycinum]|uniref:Uncharacterized protein n=1 Tax=Sesamum calycinum TaxID=2727403 RepID=A0AAW2QVF4_9LAMI
MFASGNAPLLEDVHLVSYIYGGRTLVQSCQVKEDGSNTVQTSPGSRSGYNSPPTESSGANQENERKGLRRSGAESKPLQNSVGCPGMRYFPYLNAIDAWCVFLFCILFDSEFLGSAVKPETCNLTSYDAHAAGPHAGFMCPDGEAPVRGEFGGTGSPSKMARSSSAAGNIIVLCDSDDENPPMKQPVLQIEIRIGKEAYPKSGKDNLPINEKKNQILKPTNDGIGPLQNNFPVKPTPSPISHSVFRSHEEKSGTVCDSQTPLQKFNALKDGYTTDSEDESCSDSCMDELIANLESEKLRKKWMFEADMLRAFQEDVELCMNAVCALYRQQFFTGKSAHGSSKHGVFSHIDSISLYLYVLDIFEIFSSGRALAEYLIDGDPELRLKKSVSDVKEERPDVLSKCRKLATVYIEKLFKIYCNREDPFFGQA